MGNRQLRQEGFLSLVGIIIVGFLLLLLEFPEYQPPKQHNTHWSSNVTQAILYCSEHAFIIGEMAYIQGATPEQERLLVTEDFDLCIKQTNVAI